MNFEIKLPLFEGPFDLLLFFIERDELDIHDIPISKITKDFLEYIKHLETMNIEVASEFILVAATLMRIKSKMLLPRPVIDEEGNEIDPRDELVKHLLEYKKYKSVLEELSKMEGAEIDKEKRGNILKEIQTLAAANNVEEELQDLDLYKLLKVFQQSLEKYEIEKSRPVHQVRPFPFTIEGQRNMLLSKVSNKKKVPFTEIMEIEPSKIGVIFNFLAILDLLQLRKIKLTLGEGLNNFWIEERIEA